MHNLIFIPARKDSKGLKNKNIKNLNGLPLIEHTLLQVKKLKINKSIVFVSTDSKQIIKIAEKYSFKTGYIRPSKLSKDKSNIYDAIIDGINWLKKNKKINIQNIILLQPTSPLRNSNEITKAFKYFKEKKLNSLFTITPVIQSPREIISIDNKNNFNFILNNKNYYQRQQNKNKYFFIDGSIYIIDFITLRNKKKLITSSSSPYLINKKYSIDIDDNEDFIVAKKILKND